MRSLLPLVLGGLLGCASGSPGTSTIPECGIVSGLGLSAFVGERIDVVEVPPPPDASPRFDQHYRARYRVLQRICGDVTGAEIEFDVYSHRGYPAFAEYDIVLLYVSRYETGYIHQRYQYDPVYRAKDGTWAGCGDPYVGVHPSHRGTVQTTSVDLVDPVSFSVAHLDEEYISQTFSPEYYVRDGDHIVCNAGAPVEQLYAITRLGVLRAREPAP